MGKNKHKHNYKCVLCSSHHCAGKHNPRDCANNDKKKTYHDDDSPDVDDELVQFAKYKCTAHNYEIINNLYIDHLEKIEQRVKKPWELVNITFNEWFINNKSNWIISNNQSWLKEHVYTSWELHNAPDYVIRDNRDRILTWFDLLSNHI